MEGGAGNDTYVVDVAGDEILLETAGTGIDTVVSAVTKVLGEHLEHLTLSGAAAIDGTGNAANNLIRGNTGANVLRGLAGEDTLEGDLGDDTYHVEDAGDVVNESTLAGGGNDTIVTALNGYSLATRDYVENLTLTGNARIGVGNGLANRLKGNDLANDLSAGDGDDTLDGGGGVDTLRGGADNDTYIVDVASDNIAEEEASGTDTIVASFSISLVEQVTGGVTPVLRWANFENLTLAGTAAIDATGNELGNKLVGNSAANVLQGGLGNDTMEGGGGNDTYHVDAAGDVVTETDSTTAGGTDLVKTSLNVYAVGANVENVTFTGSGNFVGTGNSLANYITGGTELDILEGGTGNDTLDGGGKADTMRGGTGNDTYYVDSASDVLEESNATDGGNDRVNSSVTWVLDAGNTEAPRFESLVLTGTRNINGTGNSLANQMVGNNGNNVLDGKGGADIMIGGAGNDIYYYSSGDQIFENGEGGGIDTVRTDLTSYALPGTLENPEFIFAAGQTVVGVQGVGNILANKLQGNAGKDFLDGSLGNDEVRGPAGDDTLFGGLDNDKVYGGTGKDHTSGGAGNDTLSGEDGNDAMFGGSGADSLLGGAGDDLMFADGDGLKTGNTYDVKGTVNTLKGGLGNDQLSGGIGNDRLYGEDGTDRMFGGAGNDLLDGGAGKDIMDGGTGYDTMAGGASDDTYYVDSKYDVISESRTGGIDTVVSTVSRVLGSYREYLLLAGKANLSATGNTLANKLFGNDGDNVIDGASGADTMVGGKGNDTYHVDNMKDAIGEAKGGGTDQSSPASASAWRLPENLTLTGKADITGAGNTLANRILGNSGNNSLIGNGGQGHHHRRQGQRHLLRGRRRRDRRGERRRHRPVVASASRTLGANEENLLFRGTKGYKGAGNALDNVLLGSAAGDLLDGGAGNDQCWGRRATTRCAAATATTAWSAARARTT
ncbi:hypothetical protein HK414_27930 [Ramlibacter terrae]|uniref:Calcium-binding protein n=1 Tax=Ramlibacter terrae TaxID=2732511 RepID=A0ABX6P867_9BURK|nr:hypothetical protein HK414_27930 [Ramlibacter terrae]